jgi:hypothetical protein
MGVKLGLSFDGKKRLRVLENRALGRIYGPKSGQVTEDWIRLHVRRFMICTPYQIFLD